MSRTKISLVQHETIFSIVKGPFCEVKIGDYVRVLVNLANNSPMAGVRKLPDDRLQYVYVTGDRQDRDTRTYVESWVNCMCSGKPSRVLRQQSRQDISGLLEVDIAI